MKAIEKIIEKASALNGTVVLPEGMDARVITAACACVDRKICTPVVLGTPEEIAAAEAKAGLSLAERGIKTIDYTADPLGDELAAIYLEAWNAKESRKPPEKQKIIDLAAATKTLRTKRIYFGGMMVKRGMVDGLVAGSIASTGDMLRAAFHTLGTQKGVKTASSCFIMDLREPTPSGDSVLAFGDCAVIPNPTTEQLVDIGLSTAQTYRDLTGNEPRVAFLSFSTKGSAAGELVEKVQKAVELGEARVRREGHRDGRRAAVRCGYRACGRSAQESERRDPRQRQRVHLSRPSSRQHRLQDRATYWRRHGDRPEPPGSREGDERSFPRLLRRGHRRYHLRHLAPGTG